MALSQAPLWRGFSLMRHPSIIPSHQAAFDCLLAWAAPATEYEDTRHNAGFWWIDTLARHLSVTCNLIGPITGWSHGPTPQGLCGCFSRKPMNVSGKSVGALARFFKINPDEILVAHDELDIPPWQVKLKKGGSHGGHNGLRDIHAQLGTPRLLAPSRLVLGTRRQAKVAAFVLRKPPCSRNAS